MRIAWLSRFNLIYGKHPCAENTMNFTASKEIGNSRILGIFFGNASGLESTIEDILIAMRYSIALEGSFRTQTRPSV